MLRFLEQTNELMTIRRGLCERCGKSRNLIAVHWGGGKRHWCKECVRNVNSREGWGSEQTAIDDFTNETEEVD